METADERAFFVAGKNARSAIIAFLSRRRGDQWFHVPVPFYPPDDASSEELRGRVRALADLVARAPVPIAVAHDAECRFISANAALARLLGVAPGELIAAAAALHQLR